jgi:hypothetical protein
MLKQAIAFILLMSFVMQVFNKVFIVIDYNINTAAFAANCENKKTPLLKCNGKCQMIKALKAEDQKDQQYPDRRGDNKNEIVICDKSFFVTNIQMPPLSISFNYALSIEGKVVKMNKGIFRPPCL